MEKNRVSFFLSLALAVLFCLPACNNLVSPPDKSAPAESGASGMALFTVNFGAGEARQILPPLSFDHYRFIFTPYAGETAGAALAPVDKAGGEDLSFTLPVGSYKLAVTGYRGDVAEGNTAARGETDLFTLAEGGNSPVRVRLNGVLSGGTGTFQYAITAPEGAAVEELSLYGGSHIDLKNGNTLSGSQDIAAGSYFLVVRLSKGGKSAGYADQAEIHANNTSIFTYEFKESHFRTGGSGGGDTGGNPGSIALNQSGTVTLTQSNYGYTAAPSVTATVTNTGAARTVNIALSGTNAGSFTAPASLSLPGNGPANFTVAAKPGLLPGAHTATVTVSGDGVDSKNFNVSFNVTNVGSETPYFAGFKYRDAAGANGGADNRQLVRDYLAYYEGQEQVLRITPEGKDYTWAFVNYAITNTQSVTGNISMKMWVSGTGTPLVTWDASVDGTRPQFISQNIPAGQWVTLNGTQRTWTPKSDSRIIALDVGGLVGRTIYITDVVITGVSPALNGVVNEGTTGGGGDTGGGGTTPEGISLSAGTITFRTATAGYPALAAKTITVTNTGAARTVNLSLGGTNAASFTLEPASLSLAANGSGAFTVVPKTALAQGNYIASVTAAAPDSDKTAALNFAVTASNVPNPDPDFHIYLAFGQSNMQGPGAVEDVDRARNPRFFTLNVVADTYNYESRAKNEWYYATSPLIIPDSNLGNSSQSGQTVGVSPADNFGRVLTANTPPNVRIGVIAVANGDTALAAFAKEAATLSAYSPSSTALQGMNRYKNAGYSVNNIGSEYKALIDNALIAQKYGVIKGIIVHQGESGLGTGVSGSWGTMFASIYNNMLADLGLPANSIPILAGQTYNGGTGGSGGALASDTALRNATGITNAHVISSSGLENRGDSVHFSSKGIRELGERYANKMIAIHGYSPIGGGGGGEDEEPPPPPANPGTVNGITITWSYANNSLLPDTAARTVSAGTNVSLTASPGSSGITRYEWYVDGLKVSGATTASYTFSTTGKSGKYNIFVVGFAGSNNTPVNGDKIVITVQ